MDGLEPEGYFVLCGLNVPSLRLLWGDPQLYILRACCKSGIIVDTKLLAFTVKKKYAALPQKKIICTNDFFSDWLFFVFAQFIRKRYMILLREKITRTDGFFVPKLHFSQVLGVVVVAVAVQRVQTDHQGPPTLRILTKGEHRAEVCGASGQRIHGIRDTEDTVIPTGMMENSVLRVQCSLLTQRCVR